MEAIAFWPESGAPLYMPSMDDEPTETVFAVRRSKDGARFAIRVTLELVTNPTSPFRLRFLFPSAEFWGAPYRPQRNVAWLPMATNPTATLDVDELRWLGEYAAHQLNAQLDEQEREEGAA